MATIKDTPMQTIRGAFGLPAIPRIHIAPKERKLRVSFSPYSNRVFDFEIDFEIHVDSDEDMERAGKVINCFNERDEIEITSMGVVYRGRIHSISEKVNRNRRRVWLAASFWGQRVY